MPKQYVNPETLFPSVQHGFSQVVVASGQRTVYISGQTAWDANRQIASRTVGGQIRQALRNVVAAVDAVGGTAADVVSLRIYIVNHSPQFNETISSALRETFGVNPPASTWIGVSSLAVGDFLVEIEATAVLD
jgi:enamine deaminase RidA (YjgF/YER057c/UK114 family)